MIDNDEHGIATRARNNMTGCSFCIDLGDLSVQWADVHDRLPPSWIRDDDELEGALRMMEKRGWVDNLVYEISVKGAGTDMRINFQSMTITAKDLTALNMIPKVKQPMQRGITESGNRIQIPRNLQTQKFNSFVHLPIISSFIGSRLLKEGLAFCASSVIITTL
ncbi:hypothetical protein BOTCAL_0092g00190 [Botryotinia calthae]|uniref:Uncharacterized protein n=1 Tax=Botryotinia calthae TaxID=38488 RepID=A0A4Y8D6X7_9HELO|nr:hypothetical protein BOTCAL_0092g00190 [Botryotinia calthae]